MMLVTALSLLCFPSVPIAGEPVVTQRVWLDISVGGGPPERLWIGMFGEHVPKTVDNFVELIKGSVTRHGTPLTYKGSKLHRIINGFMAQGGDITRGDGRGGDSIWGGAFADEAFRYKHNKAGRLSMANSGPNTNKSQFFITFKPTPHLNGKHVVFGQVEGVDVPGGHPILNKLEGVGTRSGKPAQTVEIVDCGTA
jgi:peptidyl-prolyl isomerase G (cyclophilin G)